MRIFRVQHRERGLAVAMAAAALLALAVPARWQAVLIGPFATVAEFVVAPVSGPLHRAVAWARPGAVTADAGAVAVLESERDDLRARLLQQLDENRRLRALLDEARIRLTDGGAVEHRAARVILSTQDAQGAVLTVGAGEREGVRRGDVATVGFANLLGRVTGVRGRTSTVVPVTAAASGEVRGVIVRAGASTQAELAGGLITQLVPRGDGTLLGDVEDKRDAQQRPLLPVAGDVVRLSDPRWPAHAQMLVVGVVESVEKNPRQPLRTQVRVRPAAGDLARAGEVMLRLAGGDEGGTGTRAAQAEDDQR